MVSKVKHGWLVTMDGVTYFMNRYGVVWRRQDGSFWNFDEFGRFESEFRNVTPVRVAVQEAGYACKWDAKRHEFVWSQRMTAAVHLNSRS